MNIATTARKTSLAGLLDILNAQADVRYDVVASAADLEMRHGNLLVRGGAVDIVDDPTGGLGVASVAAHLAPTGVFDEGVANRFNIPLKYVRTMRDRVAADVREVSAVNAPTLYDENVNYWLTEDPGRRHLVRGFRTDDAHEVGIARALLSDRYKPIDNYDVLYATLDGVRQAGVNVDITGDLSDRKMCVRLVCPEVSAYAPELLNGYRSPYSGDAGADNPTVFAGFVIKNSETGGGAFTIVPRLVVQVCSNGLQMTTDAVREVHLGGKLDEGVVRWSDDTNRRELELVTARTRDAVATFLDADYMTAKIAELRLLADATVEQPVKALHKIGRKHNWSETEQEAILSHFIGGGDSSALGVAQAITSFAQSVESPDRADELEVGAMAAAQLVAVG